MPPQLVIPRTTARSLVLPLAAGAVLVLSSPFAGLLRSALRAFFSARFALVMGGAVLLLAAAALVLAVAGIRERRGARYLTLALAFGLAILFSRFFATENAEIDVVEAVHFLQYGLVTWLFYRVWHGRGDLSVLLFPVLAALLVALSDEWLQWFVPSRVGEIRDVALDVAAILCGMLFSVAVTPPAWVGFHLRRGTSTRVSLFLAATIFASAAFIYTIHLAWRVDVDPHTAFLSRFPAEELDAAARDRAARWGGQPRGEARPISREDQYVAEAVWHLNRRNQAAVDGESDIAWKENALLERFFDPVLDQPASSGGVHRWKVSDRAEMARRAVDALDRPFVSEAAPVPLYPWNRTLFAASVALLLVLVVVGCSKLEARSQA